MSVEQKLDALNAKLDALVSAISKVPAFADALGGGGGAGAAEDDGSSHPSILAYDELANTHIKAYLEACGKIDGIKNLGELAQTGFDFLRKLLIACVKCKKPSVDQLQKFCAPLIDIGKSGDKLIDNRSTNFPHQKASFEFLSALGWVFISPTPIGHVQAQLESGDFYLNKILTTFKGDDKDHHRQFVKAIKDTLKEMQPFIKSFHTTGLFWNAKGQDLAEYASGATAAKPAAAGPPVAAAAGPRVGGPPMGPPTSGGPPAGLTPPPASDAAAAAPAAGAVGIGAVFAQINSGHASLVSGLRKVTKDMKNKDGQIASDLAAKEVPKPKAAPPAAAAPKAAATAPAQEPRMFEKQGKWFVEHFQGGQVELPAAELNQKQNVYIYKCINTLVIVPGKCKAICVDSCSKSNVICQSVVSTFEVVNCKNVGVQINEMAPAIAIDKSASIILHLSASAVAANPDIVTSNITAVNVSIPGKQPDDDPIEIPLPEQYMTKFTTPFTLKTGPTEHSD